MKYVEEYYKDETLIGRLSDVWGVRSYNLAKLKFNDQYPFDLSTHDYEQGRDQALNTPKDRAFKI